MSKKPSIARCSPADSRDIAALQQGLWAAGTKQNLAYLDWKYHANPYLDDRYTVLARQGDGHDASLIGMVGVFGSCWEADGQRFMLPCLTDTIVMPEYRNGPIFHEMIDVVLGLLHRDGIPWLLDFGDQGTTPAMLVRGWRAVGPWAQFAVTRNELAPTRRQWSQFAPMRGQHSGVPIRATSTVDVAAMVEVACAVSADGRVRVARDAAYFMWRANNPLAKYYYLIAGEKNAAGYLVGHRSRVDTDEGETPTTIVECEARTGEILADLLETAHEYLPGKKLLMWARDLPQAGADALSGLGADLERPTGRFTRDRPLPNLMIRDTGAVPVPPALMALDRPERWDLRGVSGRGWR